MALAVARKVAGTLRVPSAPARRVGKTRQLLMRQSLPLFQISGSSGSRCGTRIIVGWGERSDPHQFCCGPLLVGLVSLSPIRTKLKILGIIVPCFLRISQVVAFLAEGVWDRVAPGG